VFDKELCNNALLFEDKNAEYFYQEELLIEKDENSHLSEGEPNGIDDFVSVYFAYFDG
jgi:hypothetical protein